MGASPDVGDRLWCSVFLLVVPLVALGCVTCAGFTLKVDEAFCATRGGLYTHQCLDEGATLFFNRSTGDGDRLMIAGGTWRGCSSTGIFVATTNAIVSPIEGSGDVVIDCQLKGRAFFVSSTRNLTFNRVSILNGNSPDIPGCALANEGGLVTFRNARIEGCVCPNGAVSLIFNSQLTLVNVTFTNNTGSGGAINVNHGSRVTVIGSTFWANTVVGSTGAAISCVAEGKFLTPITLIDSLVAHNTATNPRDPPVLSSLSDRCAYVSLNGTEVYGDVISVTPSLVTGGNNVTVDWYLPGIFTRNRTVASFFLAGVEGHLESAVGYTAVAVAAGGSPSAYTRIHGVELRAADGAMLAYGTQGSYANPPLIRADPIHGSDVPAGSGAACVTCDPTAGCRSLKCALGVATRAGQATSTVIDLAPGTFTGPNNIGLVIAGSFVHLRGAGVNVTRIACGQGDVGPAISFRGGPVLDETPRLSGLTLAGCSSSASGGCLSVENVEPVITSVVVEGCSSTLFGGGVLVSLTDQMANSTGNYTLGTGLIVRDCHAGEAGGGVAMLAADITMHFWFDGLQVSGCTAPRSVGGALYVDAADSAVSIAGGSVFYNNSALVGGAVSVWTSVTYIADAVFDRNTGSYYGGAVSWGMPAGVVAATAVASHRQAPNPSLMVVFNGTSFVGNTAVFASALFFFATGTDMEFPVIYPGVHFDANVNQRCGHLPYGSWPLEMIFTARNPNYVPENTAMNLSVVMVDLWHQGVCGPAPTWYTSQIESMSNSLVIEPEDFRNGIFFLGDALPTASYNELRLVSPVDMSITLSLNAAISPFAPDNIPPLSRDLEWHMDLQACGAQCLPGGCVGGNVTVTCVKCLPNWDAKCFNCDANHYGPTCALTTTCVHGVPNTGGVEVLPICNGTCFDHFDGNNCDACQTGWLGGHCHFPVVAIVVIAAVAVVAALAATGLWCYRRARHRMLNREEEVLALLESRIAARNGTLGSSRGGGVMGSGISGEDLHEQSLLSTASLSDFSVVRSIAAGSNGQIFEVECKIPQAPAGRHYALKIIFNYGVETNDMRNAYANEFLALSRLPPHRNIVRFFGEFREQIPAEIYDHLPQVAQELALSSTQTASYTSNRYRSAQFMLMEFCLETLEAHVNSWDYPAPWEVLFDFASDLVSAFEWLWSHNLVHLDHKFDNILVGPGDGRAHRLVLCDFGSAQFCDKDWLPISNDRLLDGNMAHKAPEVLNGLRKPSGLICVSKQGSFALGVLLHRLATGAPPLQDYPHAWQGEDGMINYVPVAVPKLDSLIYPEQFCTMVRSLLVCQPRGRATVTAALLTMEELGRALTLTTLASSSLSLAFSSGGSSAGRRPTDMLGRSSQGIN